MLLSSTLTKKKGSANNIENPFLVSSRILQDVAQKIASHSSGVITLQQLVLCFCISSPTKCDMVELFDIHSKKPMEVLFNLEQIQIQVAKYFEIWSFHVYRVNPHVPSLPMPPPHNCVQNKRVKVFHHFRVRYLCTVQRVLKTHWVSQRLDWTRLGRCEHPLTLQSLTGLDSTRLDSTLLVCTHP